MIPSPVITRWGVRGRLDHRDHWRASKAASALAIADAHRGDADECGLLAEFAHVLAQLS